MTDRYFIRRDFVDIFPFLDAIRAQADSEREALGFLPEPAYAEAARQRKIILLLSQNGDQISYAGHLLFGGIFPSMRVRQISVTARSRRSGQATTLLRALIAQGEKEGYLSIVANVATDLAGANAFYERNGFVSVRLKLGGKTRNRRINVRILQLQTPSLISLMVGPTRPKPIEIIQPKKRSPEIPIYAIDLNVFYDAIRKRIRSDDAGAVFEAALNHQIRIAATQEFISELKRTSNSPNDDPVLSLAKRIPNLPIQDKATIEKIKPIIASLVFPERAAGGRLKLTDQSDISHLAHAVAAGVSGYITSDTKVLSARDALMTEFNLDVIGLSEFVDLLDLPDLDEPALPAKATKNFRIQRPSAEETIAFIESKRLKVETFLIGAKATDCVRSSVSDSDGIIGVSLLLPASALEQPSRSVVCVHQEHPFSSTVADFLLSEQIRQCTQNSACHLLMLDIPSHPITRRIAFNLGFQQQAGSAVALAKIALGQPVTSRTWDKARLSIERLAGLKLQVKCPTYDTPKTQITTSIGDSIDVGLFELETLLSPTLFALPRRKAVLVPITRSFASDLLGTDLQYSFLEVPEAYFLTRRTYFNTTRATRSMIRGSAILFYESSRGGGRGAVVAVGRIIDVTSILVSSAPESLRRGAVVDDLGTLTKSDRILATTFDNLVAFSRPVALTKLRQIGCVPKANFVSATPISAKHLTAIVEAGSIDD
ncbi:MAG: GNAT family N-acetyltransferase [Bradyrhizobium sp.]|uniref:GNAT family N-acetyltransferase n=1 Tax=Bradyrhizobium sp. TaxID=376 RepID=UPI00272F077D|nr:GNAT family N-acetyltransferase [Bradyrhizobium sp.]MDP1867674.1 GNAT family N-acetyltransferase [Bradyrhizobium sp.]